MSKLIEALEKGIKDRDRLLKMQDIYITELEEELKEKREIIDALTDSVNDMIDIINN